MSSMDESNLSRFHSASDGHNEAKLRTLVAENPGNFDAWTSLIKIIEKISPNDIEGISSAYDMFLSEFPLCYVYWKKYADHKARLCTKDMVLEVYERAVKLATYSVGLWVCYCRFGMLSFEDPADVRRLFERALSFVGKDYSCYLLWDKYIDFEHSQKQWSRLAHIFLRTLRFPTKKLHIYYKRLASIFEEMTYQGSDVASVCSETVSSCGIPEAKAYKNQEISNLIEDLVAPSTGVPSPNTLKKYLSTGEFFYQKASDLDLKIKCFENRIRRSYFHIKQLDSVQLENWHCYLDFVEMQGDFDWAVKLYERCLIPCANCPELWIRYVLFAEAMGGREIANLSLVRATEIYLKRVPQIHIFCARFKEQIGDICGARAALLHCSSNLESDFIEHVTRKANMEKRLGNIGEALMIYERALAFAKEKQNSHTLGILYSQYSQFKYMVTASTDAARDILIKGIQHVPQCTLLFERLIHFEMMHGDQRKIDVLDSIIAEVTAPKSEVHHGLSARDREDVSNLFLEFVDLCGSIHDIRKAWDRHRKLFTYQMGPVFSDQGVIHRSGPLDGANKEGNDGIITLTNHSSQDNNALYQDQDSVPKDTSLQETAEPQVGFTVIHQSTLDVNSVGTSESLQEIENAVVVEEKARFDTIEHHLEVQEKPKVSIIEHIEVQEKPRLDTTDQHIQVQEKPGLDTIEQHTEVQENPRLDTIEEHVKVQEKPRFDAMEQLIDVQQKPRLDTSEQQLEAQEKPGLDTMEQHGEVQEDPRLNASEQCGEALENPRFYASDRHIDVQEHSRLEIWEQHMDIHNSVLDKCIETSTLVEDAEVSKQIESDNNIQDDLVPPSLETCSIRPKEAKTQQLVPLAYLDCQAMEETSASIENGAQNEDDPSDISVSDSKPVQSDMPLQSNLQMGDGNIHVESDSNSQAKMQIQPHENVQQGSYTVGENWQQMNYAGQGHGDPASFGHAEVQQNQQWQFSQQPHYQVAGVQSNIFTGQSYQYQPWQYPQAQQAGIGPNQYQVATGQVYSAGTQVWPTQSFQPHSFASVPQSNPSAQPVSRPQLQVFQYQYPYQSGQQFSHVQTDQSFTTQTYNYYQQHQQPPQQYQLQQQQLPQQQHQQQIAQQLHSQKLVQQQTPLQLRSNHQVQQRPPQQQIPQQLCSQQQQLHPQHYYQQQPQLQIQTWNYNHYAQGQAVSQQDVLSGHVEPQPHQQVSSSQ